MWKDRYGGCPPELTPLNLLAYEFWQHLFTRVVDENKAVGFLMRMWEPVFQTFNSVESIYFFEAVSIIHAREVKPARKEDDNG